MKLYSLGWHYSNDYNDYNENKKIQKEEKERLNLEFKMLKLELKRIINSLTYLYQVCNRD